MDVNELKELKMNPLRKLCKDVGLLASGKKKELLDRLILKKQGVSERFVGSLTICHICSAKVRIRNTSRREMEDGRVMVTRTVRCLGKHNHTYPLKEVIESKKASIKPDIS